MKFIIVLLLASFCLAVVQSQEEQQPPPRPKSNLLRRAGQRVGVKTTSTTTQAPQQNEEYEDAEYPPGEDYPENENAKVSEEPSTTTSTEPPKRVGPIIRPFRSNDDLLQALRKRQQNMKLAKKTTTEKPREESAEPEEESGEPQSSAPVAHSNKPIDRNGRKRFGIGARPAAPVPKPAEPESEEPVDEPAPARRVLGRSRVNLGRRNTNQ